jgi:hypothetical protein
MNFECPKRNYFFLFLFYVAPFTIIVTTIADVSFKNFIDYQYSKFWTNVLISTLGFLYIFYIHKTNEKNQIQYGSFGLKFPEWNNETYEWNQINFKIEYKKILYIIPIISLDIILKDKSTYMEYDITDMGSFFELVFKHCPQDHELYKLVEEYQKK